VWVRGRAVTASSIALIAVGHDVSMASQIQITVDAAGPRALTAFGIDQADPDRAFAIVDPVGAGPRVFFLKVPEDKIAENRLHLDVHVEPEGHWITMLDPEGNEFCLH
jgi:hypothetical protein